MLARANAALSELVRSISQPEVVDDFCFDSLRRLLAAASWRVEQADGGLGHDCPIPPGAEVRCWWLEGRQTGSDREHGRPVAGARVQALSDQMRAAPILIEVFGYARAWTGFSRAGSRLPRRAGKLPEASGCLSAEERRCPG